MSEQCKECGCEQWDRSIPDRPATEEEIRDIQEQLSRVANDPNLTIVTRGHCFCDCHQGGKV